MTRFSALLIGALLSLAAFCARADIVGNVGAVNQAAQGTPPGGAARMLSLGAGVANRERIETKNEGKAQIVFLDKSTLTVGQNSSVTIDKFVYDGKVGKQSVSIAKGALRFIGGEVSHGSGMEIKTPAATIGVRGGMVLILVGGPNGDEIILLYGTATITVGGQVVKLLRPGFGVTISSLDQHISEPALASEESIESFDQQFASAPGQTGGVSAAQMPTDSQATMRLGDFRMPDHTPWGGLAVIGAHWGGQSVAQSRAQANNQTVAATTQKTIAILTAPPKDPPTSSLNPGNPGSMPGALFANGFCVWGCVNPTFVSQNVSGNVATTTLRADFSGHGYFMITMTGNVISINQPQNTVSINGTWAVSTEFHPTSGGPVATNTYNVNLTGTYSWQGFSLIGNSPTFTSRSVSGSDTLIYVNASNISASALLGQSTNSFFLLPNNFYESFNFTFP